MAPNHVAANVLGTMGTICWTGQILPQIWKSWREKSTKGMSDWLMLLWGLSSVPLGAYALLQNLNIPLIVQPQLFGLLCLISWGQCQYYERRRSLRVSLLITLGMVLLSGAIELALVLAIRPMNNLHGKGVATKVFGVLSAVLISGALFPQYYEIYKYKAVMGISLVFLAIDILGGLLNDLSLAYSEEFDILAAVSYSLVVVLDGIIILLAGIFKVRDWRRSKRTRTLSTHEAEPTSSPGAEVDKKESVGQDPQPGDESTRHLTVLLRIGSRLSDTPGIFEWTVGDVNVERRDGQHVDMEMEGGKGDAMRKGG